MTRFWKAVSINTAFAPGSRFRESVYEFTDRDACVRFVKEWNRAYDTVPNLRHHFMITDYD